MKTSAIILLIGTTIFSLSATKTAAQLFGPARKTEHAVLSEFALANGGQLPALTTDPLQSSIYITIDNTIGRVFATTNFKADTTEKTYNIMLVQGGMLQASELHQMFDGAAADFSVTSLPIWIHNDVLRMFLDTRFLDAYPNTTVVSEQGKRYTVRNQRVEVRPGFFLKPSIELDKTVSFLFERSFDPSAMEVLSLLNNKEINDRIANVFTDFQAIRTVDHIEKAFAKSKKNVICLFGHISADGQVLRYRSDGTVSYELPATQFLHLGADLNKEVILVGCNFADDTSRTLDVAAEINLLETALKNKYWGEVLHTLAGQANQVQVTEPNTDGFYFKRAEVSRPTGVKPARAYSIVFFKTPAKPPTFVAALRFIFGHSGKIFLALSVLQLLFFFVFKGRWAAVLRWVNLALLGIFLFVFLFSFL